MHRSLLIVLWLGADALAGCSAWLNHLYGLDYWDRLAEIRSVSNLSITGRRERVPDLVQLLRDQDSSVRVVAAEEIAEIHAVAEAALPRLIENFARPNGEEGMTYVDAAVRFGERALPALRHALASREPLVRARACDALNRIQRVPASGTRCEIE